MKTCVLLIACGLAVSAAASDGPSPQPDLPAQWLQAWSAPPAELRPLQILHGVPASQANAATMARLKRVGLGGIVCNVSFADYLRSEAAWTALVHTVEACRQAGLRVWIYDEEGYPSGAAGGRVLESNPALEAQVLAYDPSAREPFQVRRAYEYTHAANNYYARRRAPNLIEPGTTAAFLDQTHAAYWERVGNDFGSTIEAFFTDEPALLAVHLGSMKDVRVQDPPDPNVRLLATVPWCSDLAEQYRKRYGQDLLPVRRSLFTGATPGDRQVRRQFWELVSELMADRYFGRIQQWCGQHRVASSGHMLWEEQLLHHVPLYGNFLKSLARMDVPGLDVLSSNPLGVVGHAGWLAAGLPMSAALLNGRRRVMTEVSDFSERGKSDLPMIEATAAWQSALGVTEFTLYYGTVQRILARPPSEQLDLRGDFPRYCDYVGRLNAMVRAAQPAPNVLLYYPIRDLWEEYLPVAERLTLDRQSERAGRLVRSFWNLGRRLLTNQVSFALADHEMLGAAQVHDGAAWINGHRFEALVLPADVELPQAAQSVAERLAAAGGCVLRDSAAAKLLDIGDLCARQTNGHIQPACDWIVVGRFIRQQRPVLVVVNVGQQAYSGRMSLQGDRWWLADPSSGEIHRAKVQDGHLQLALPGRSAMILVGP